ncbi:MAG: four helix bundle protein [Alphaproteobacteria bacterium]
MKSYRDLTVWRLAMDIAEQVYLLTKAFPNSETYGMTTQIRRAAVSIAANIAEGHGRETSGAFVSFLRIAQGSLKELETHLLLSVRVGLADQAKTESLMQMCDEQGRMLRSLIRSIQSKADQEE